MFIVGGCIALESSHGTEYIGLSLTCLTLIPIWGVMTETTVDKNNHINAAYIQLTAAGWKIPKSQLTWRGNGGSVYIVVGKDHCNFNFDLTTIKGKWVVGVTQKNGKEHALSPKVMKALSEVCNG